MHLAEPIAFPDAEALLVDWASGFMGVPVSTKIPNPRPDRFVRVLRTGGPRQGLVTDQAQVTFECWGTDNVDASDLARTLRAHVGALGGRRIGTVQVHRVQELSGPANLPDATSGQARYTWTVFVDLRGHAI